MMETWRFYVPYRLVWDDWFAFWDDQDEYYYDVWF